MFYLSIFTIFAIYIVKKTKLVTKIIISLGANVSQLYHIEQAKALLLEYFVDVTFTDGLWTEPIGMESEHRFLNMLCFASTSLSKVEVNDVLKRIEQMCGRRPVDKKRGIILMDADLLLYGTERLHLPDWDRSYVKELLSRKK